MKEKDLLLNTFFISGLILLVLNDLLLKWYFSNFITGKLSDLAGLFILPIFVAFIFPKSKKFICFIIGLLFIVWKSPLSSSFIDLVNSLSMIKINRVVDYSDLATMVVLPFSHLLINNYKFKNIKLQGHLGLIKRLTLVIAGFAFLSTSVMRLEMPKGTVYLGKSHTIKMSKDSLLSRINSLGYKWKYMNDTLSNPEYYDYTGYYQIDSIIIEDEGVVIDTLKNIKFDLREMSDKKLILELINVELMEPGNIQNWKYLRRLNKIYKKHLKKNFINEIKE